MKPAKKKPAGSIVRLEATEGWKVTRKPAPAKAAASARRRSATGEAAEPVVPDFLPKNAYEVLDVVEVEPVGGARRSAAGSEVKLRATVPPDTSVLLLIRQESGAIAFRRPSEVARRGAAAGKAAAVEVEFDVPVLAGDPQDRRRGLLSFVTAALVKIVKKAVDVVVDKAAELVVPFLARKLEERLWQGRHQGWLHVTQATLAAKKLVPKVPDFGEGERALLFIHGTFSDAGSAFTDLATTPFFEALREVYGDNIFAFDHFTFSKTLEENAQDMLAALPHRTFQFDVITHSRGGLVLRAIAEAANSAPANTARLCFGQVVLVASPNGGTPLVTPQHWDDKLSWMANILEMFPDNPFTTAGEWLAGALSWFADKVVGNAPGLMTMDMQGEVIANLQQGGGAPSGATYYALAANFHAPQKWWSRLADMGVDSFFGGANDLVVPTEGGWQVDIDPAFWVPSDRIGCFGLQGNIAPQEPSAVNHINFFARAETADFILRALAGEPLGLPLLASQQSLPTRRGARAAMAAGAVFKVPPLAPVASAPVLAEAAPKVTPLSESLFKPKGFGDEDVLTLTVIAHDTHTDIEKDYTVPLLLATYAGARVTVPFFIRGDSIGTRWREIIDKQKFMVAYANGNNRKFTLKNGTVIDQPTEAFLREFGAVLFETLFPNEVRRLYDAARFRHDKRKLNIIFTSMIPWVADFPWEFAFDPSSETFLSTADVRFVRNVLTVMPENRIADYPGKLRMLVVSALPSGSVPVSIEQEQEGVRLSFKPLIDAGLVEVDVIVRATPKLLHQQLRERLKGRDYDILHFIGHGTYDPEKKTGYLIFEDEDRAPKSLSADEFLDILRNRGIRIVFLNACETGRGGDAYYNRGVAMALVRDGIPAVVANQYSVLDRAASLFSLHFYSCLAFGIPLGDAIREARIAIRYSAMEPMDWGVPVLFARNPNASLYDNGLFPPPGISPPAQLEAPAGPLARRRMFQDKREMNHLMVAGRLKISVWDVANILPYREDLESSIADMNRAQGEFYFRLERMTAPRGLLRVDAIDSSDVAYLTAETAAPKMEEIRKKLGVDYLFCITDLPLQDAETESLYLWYDDEPDSETVTKVIIMSTCPFEPPLTGAVLKAAFANCMVAALAEDLSKVTPRADEPKGSVGYFNDELDVRHLAGRQKFTKDNLKRMWAKSKITEEQIAALQALLGLFQPSGVEAFYPEQPAPGAIKKKREKAKVTSKAKTKVAGKTAAPAAKLKKKK